MRAIINFSIIIFGVVLIAFGMVCLKWLSLQQTIHENGGPYIVKNNGQLSNLQEEINNLSVVIYENRIEMSQFLGSLTFILFVILLTTAALIYKAHKILATSK